MSEATLTPYDLKSDLVGRLQMGHGLLYKDIAAMSNEMLADCPGGKARCGFDVVFEMAAVNRMVASVIRGDADDMPAPEGWIRSPETYRNKDEALSDIQAATNELIGAVQNASEARLNEEANTPFGAMPLRQLVGIMSAHAMYHSGQLNYIQTLHGDDAFHWGEA